MSIALITAFVVLLLANIAATAAILRSITATPTQKAVQLAFVWLIPFLGAVVVITFYWLERRNQGPQPDGGSLAGNEQDLGRQDGHPD